MPAKTDEGEVWRQFEVPRQFRLSDSDLELAKSHRMPTNRYLYTGTLRLKETAAEGERHFVNKGAGVAFTEARLEELLKEKKLKRP